jgi:hypothetical protein
MSLADEQRILDSYFSGEDITATDRSVETSRLAGVVVIGGIELECAVVGTDVIGNIRRGGHHSGTMRDHRYSRDFIAETDGSITTTGTHPKNCEFVSRPMPIANIPAAVKRWVEEHYRRIAVTRGITAQEARLQYPLAKVVDFNNSTGAHIHFSIGIKSVGKTTIRDRRAGQVTVKATMSRLVDLVIDADFMEALHQAMLEKVRIILGAHRAHQWDLRYYRHYATNMVSDSDKYTSLYIHSATHCEWRSMHLCGVRTEEELHAMVQAACDTLRDCIERHGAKEHEERVSVHV